MGSQRSFARAALLWLAASIVLAACGTPRAARHGAPRTYAQLDSATNACLRNPACYATSPGEDAILPWVSRAWEATRTAAAVLRLLEAAELKRVEEILYECALVASFKVNDALLGEGRHPTRKLCQEEFETDSRGNKVTWGMHLGREKHRVALECVQEKLGPELSENVSLQPQYRYSRKTKKLEPLDPAEVAAWLRDGLWDKLLGTLIPDVVVHASGDLSRVQDIFDFKFPCPAGNDPSWSRYSPDHPHHPLDQGAIYKEAFNLKQEPARVAPGYGVYRR
jgi:hypothetical protein